MRHTSVLVALALAATACGGDAPARDARSADPTPVVTSSTPSAAATTAPPATTKPPVTPSSAAATTRPPAPPATTQAPPPPPIQTNRRCETPPAASTGGHPRTITPSAPLDLLITGDSLQESMGPQLTAYANAKKHMVAGCTVPKYSTGLVRDDFYDWPAEARTYAAQRDPEAVSFMIGGNDAQNMSVNGRILEAGSAEWAAEYQRRAAAVMRAFADGKRKVYWIGMPIARSERHTRVFRVTNDAVRKAAAGVPGVKFIDIWAMFAPNGVYAHSFADEYGRVQVMRSSDGIHLSTAGAGYLARRMFKTLDADWNLS